MLLKLLLLCSLFILSTYQDNQNAGKETAKRDSVSQPKVTFPWSWECIGPSGHCALQNVMDNPDCCLHHRQCRRDNRKFCHWLLYLKGSVQEVQVTTAAGKSEIVTKVTKPKVNRKLVGVSLKIAFCPATNCRVWRNPACCFHHVCKQRRPRLCAPILGTPRDRKGLATLPLPKLNLSREGNMQTLSSDLLRNDDDMDASVTLCDVQAGSSQTLSVEQLEDTGEAAKIRNANCAFIVQEDDSAVSCSDLVPHCDQPADRRLSLATIACWKLNWCRRKIGTKHSLLKDKKATHGVCCYHPWYRIRANECDWTRKL